MNLKSILPTSMPSSRARRLSGSRNGDAGHADDQPGTGECIVLRQSGGWWRWASLVFQPVGDSVLPGSRSRRSIGHGSAVAVASGDLCVLSRFPAKIDDITAVTLGTTRKARTITGLGGGGAFRLRLSSITRVGIDTPEDYARFVGDNARRAAKWIPPVTFPHDRQSSLPSFAILFRVPFFPIALRSLSNAATGGRMH